jgi:hypothetical protein
VRNSVLVEEEPLHRDIRVHFSQHDSRWSTDQNIMLRALGYSLCVLFALERCYVTTSGDRSFETH